ncbi:MAG: DEAD/DEAH box helicase [Candidatus Eiseniibacteriota bacterium]|nr:MAG: DEAD/DEAH box helicase [Candidatus Eisenbacteria bacterium]
MEMARTPTASLTETLESLFSSPAFRERVKYVKRLPAREAVHRELSPPLLPGLSETLKKLGVGPLYSHQVEAIELARAGKSFVVVTGTASGKTLCYNIPVLESLLTAERANAFYIFPTKALAQDQLKALGRMAREDEVIGERLRSGTYDGDTAQHTRRKLRETANVILTNPDMLHQGILPYHTRWSRFFSDLKYVIIYEIHAYRGIFGSNVANVIRRLRRVCSHYGSDPQFVLCSATIRNPRELAQELTGLQMELISRDGSPRGPKLFVFWNPPFLDDARMERRSSIVEAKELLVELVKSGTQTIAFTKARVVAELIYRYASDDLAAHSAALKDSIRPYRAGYLPEERREIERQLFSGELMGVVSTNALELGIDVGGLDASVTIGFPGTIASTWQQAGRAGRGTREALSVLVAYNDPIDQYLMRHPEYFFRQSPENAVVAPDNPYILAGHLCAAAFELPIEPRDRALFGPLTEKITGLLEQEGNVKGIDEKWYWSRTDFPAASVNLRTISDDTYTIVDAKKDNKVIGTVDAISAPELVYPEAIYLHEGETYFTRKLDMEQKIAYVERSEVDYYTQPVLDTSLRVLGQGREKTWAGQKVVLGEADVTWATTAFKKIRFYTLESIGYKTLDLPFQHLETSSMWLIPSAEFLKAVRGGGKNPIEGLAGIRNMMINVIPLFSMCDRQDIGGIIDSSNTGTPTVFIYDRFHGGLGFAEKAYELIDEVLSACLSLVKECECREGCPSCVGLPILRPAQHQDPDVYHGWPIPSKETAMEMLSALLVERARQAPRGPASSS